MSFLLIASLPRQGISLMPAEFINLSLPPYLRYKTKNMLLWLLVPSQLSATAQLKYFKHVAISDINPLKTQGLQDGNGRRVCVSVFGLSLDLKGREKFLNQTSVQSYNGCSTCRIKFEAGTHRRLVHAVARRWLPPTHPLRGTRHDGHEFAQTEGKDPAMAKDTDFVLSCAAFAKDKQIGHFLGQKGLPMFTFLEGYNYALSNIPDWMHNLARVFTWLLKVTVGDGGEGFSSKSWGGDDAHRHECKLGGIFSGVWPDRPGYLEPAFHAALAALDPADIRREPAGWLKRWLKKCGRTYEQATPLAELRSAVVRLAEQAAAGTPIVASTGKGLLPWRLSPLALSVADKRVLNIVYPRYTPSCSKDGASFWKNANRVWRTADKLLAFLVIMPTSMRGLGVSSFPGIRRLVHGLRLLEGGSSVCLGHI